MTMIGGMHTCMCKFGRSVGDRERKCSKVCSGEPLSAAPLRSCSRRKNPCPRGLQIASGSYADGGQVAARLTVILLLLICRLGV